MILMKCDLCEKSATVHLTEIRGGLFGRQKKTERHLCDDHAKAAGLPIDSGSVEVRLSYLKLLTFIRHHKRMPTQDEQYHLGQPIVPGFEMESGSWDEQRLADLERFLTEFLSRH
jgi:hypothetical protein